MSNDFTSNYTYNPSFTGYTYSPYDIENLAKYATGVAITNQDKLTVGNLAAGAGSNLAIQGISWLKTNKGHYREAMASSAAAAQNMHNIYKSGDTFLKGVSSVANASQAAQLLSSIPDAEKLATMSKGTQELFTKAKLAAETLSQTGSSQAAATANQLLCQANAAAAKEAAATTATGFWGKLKNVLGINKASAAINTAAAKSTVGSACLNEFKAQGGPAMLVLEGATETITNVIPTFKQLGAKSGMKQIGKSSVKTVASVGGWVAGAAIGTKIGAAIGSIIPGAGTAVGAAAGAIIGSLCSLIGGTLGSRLAKKGAEKIVGKDELVLAQERQAAELAQQAKSNSAVLNQVVGAAADRLNAEGVSSEDAQIAFNSLNAVSSQQAGTATNPFTTATPSFTANPIQLQQYAQMYGLS